MAQDHSGLLVSTKWVAERLTDPGLRILDASWYLPQMNRDAAAEFDAGHLPGAQFFDIDAIAEPDTDLPHMVPPTALFAAQMRHMGIGNDSQVVIYDGAGILSAPRVWWLFRYFGHSKVTVMDGGLPKWVAEGHPINRKTASFRPQNYVPHPDPGLLRSANEVADALESETQIIEARAANRYRGEVDEPRAGLRRGRIPGSLNVPFSDLVTDQGQMRPASELKAIFGAVGVDMDRPAITTCGSGITAAVLSLALEIIGHQQHALYDGSWAEWGGRQDLPADVG